MEPLTGFFILEGLLFDIIGAYFVVSGLLNGDNKLNFLLSDLRDRTIRLQEESMHLATMYKEYFEAYRQKKPQFIIDNLRSKLEEFGEQSESDKLEHLEITTINTHNILLQIISEKQIDKLQVSRGLPFLIGGFLLQGIGVVLQLT